MVSRNIALDYAKGIGIVIVVFAHLWRGLAGAGLLNGWSPDIVAGVSSACTLLSMPIFFFVSGLLYGRSMARRHGLKEFAGKVDAIFYPYLIWSVIIGLFEMLGSGLRNHSGNWRDLLDILWNPHGIFWFLYVLLLTFALVELVILVAGVQRARLLVLPMGALLLLVYPWAPRLFCLPEFCMSFIYFALGMTLAGVLPKVQRPSWMSFVLALAGLLVFTYLAHAVWHMGTHSMRSVSPNALLTALGILLLFMTMCYALPEKGPAWLAYLGERSMDVYLVHLLFVASVRIFLQKGMHAHAFMIYLVPGICLGIGGALILTHWLKSGRARYLFSPPDFLSLRGRFTTGAQAAVV